MHHADRGMILWRRFGASRRSTDIRRDGPDRDRRRRLPSHPSEQQIASRQIDAARVRPHAREATTALADARVAQQAYVAAGQGVEFWMRQSREPARSGDGGAGRAAAITGERWSETALDEAAATVAEFSATSTGARAIPHQSISS